MQAATSHSSECIETALPCQVGCVRDGWTEFLKRWPWELFVTLTYREEPGHPEIADKQYRVLVNKVNRQLYGSRWQKKDQGIISIRAAERQQRGTLHFHALWGQTQDSGNDKEARFAWMDEWNEIAGYARIYPIEREEAVRRYVSKYVVKGGELTMEGAFNTPLLPFQGARCK